jgi:hypothetical protein
MGRTRAEWIDLVCPEVVAKFLVARKTPIGIIRDVTIRMQTYLYFNEMYERHMYIA